MGKSFSQRMGFKPVKNDIQVHSMDDDLRNSLWNDFAMVILPTSTDMFLLGLWLDFFKQIYNEHDTGEKIMEGIKEKFFELEWSRVYDFIEFVANTYLIRNQKQKKNVEDFIHSCNISLKRELSAYRFVGKRLVPNTSELELQEIAQALNVSKQYTQHLDRALSLLADRKSPDYRNSIKESISAVEAMCQLIVGDQNTTLGKALARLESKIGKYPHSLRNALNQLYDWTSEAQGIRHGLLGESDLDVEDARFMLVTCSAFIHYLAAKADKAGMQIYQE